jgi:hypothetical protein
MSKKITELDNAMNADLTWYTVVSDTSGNAKKMSLLALKNLVGISAQQLATPTLTATPASPTQINLSWINVDNEVSYQLERSLDNLNWTQIGGTIAPNVTSYNDTGLSSLTLYYYRIKAIGDNIIYVDSNWGTAYTTTNPSTAYTTWFDILTTQYEQYNSNQGIRKPLTPNTSLTDRVYTMESIQEGYGFEFTIDNILNNVFTSWLAATQTEVRTNSLFQANLNTTIRFQQLGNASGILDAASPYTAVVGDRIIFMYKDSKISVGYSKDNGSTYTIVYTYSNVPASAYYWVYGTGQAGYGCSQVIYRQALPTPPSLFKALALSGNSSVSLTWTAKSGSLGYVVQRATNSIFTTGLTTVYTGTDTSYTDTGLAGGSTYYYRLKATAGLDSTWTVKSATTSAAGDPSFLTWELTGTRNEYTSDLKGIRRMDGYNVADLNYSYSTDSIANGEAFVYSIDDISSNIFSVAINTTKTVDPGGTTNFLRVFLNGTLSVLQGASTVSSGNAVAVGNYIRISIISNVLKVEKSIDSGATWSTVYTSGLTPSGTYYLGFASVTTSYPASRTYKMTGL